MKQHSRSGGYCNDPFWQKIQSYLPLENQLDESCMPTEEWLSADGFYIHVDRYIHADSKAVVVLLHGVGGNGRLLSFIALPLWRQGYDVVCPDLPMYGYTTYSRAVSYQDWVECSVQVAEQYRQSGKPLFLFGLSAGGMLAYQAACQIGDLSGLMLTCLLDQRIGTVTEKTASSRLMAKLGKPFLKLSHRVLGAVKLPMKFVCNMRAIVNNGQLAKLMMSDPRSSGARVTLRFLHGMLNPQIEIEAQDFDKCPVLLVHPQCDYWTDVALSRLFFDRIAAEKELHILNDAGHFPIEPQGLALLEEHCVRFMEKHR